MAETQECAPIVPTLTNARRIQAFQVQRIRDEYAWIASWLEELQAHTEVIPLVSDLSPPVSISRAGILSHSACRHHRLVNGGMRSVPTMVFPDGSVLVEPTSRELAATYPQVGEKAISYPRFAGMVELGDRAISCPPHSTPYEAR
jgi:hypothetical protein